MHTKPIIPSRMYNQGVAMKRLFLYCVSALLLTTAGFAQKVVETDPLRPVETGAVTIT